MLNKQHIRIILAAFIAIFILGILGGGYYWYGKEKKQTQIAKDRKEIQQIDVSKLENVSPVFRQKTNWNIDISTKEGKAQFDKNIALMRHKIKALP